MNKKVIAILILSTLLTSCGPSIKEVSPVQKKIITLNNSADKAFEKKDYDEAIRLYKDALDLAVSIENLSSIAMNATNLSIVYRRLEKRDDANFYADYVINSSVWRFPPDELLGASIVKAQLLEDAGDKKAARESIDRAVKRCGGSECAGIAKGYNMLARYSIDDNDLVSALDYIRLAQRERDDKLETANSYRLLGDVQSKQRLFEEALKNYEKALAIDKDLGLSSKIINDLVCIGKALDSLGRRRDAVEYLNRALAVSTAAHDEKNVGNVKGLLEGMK